MKIQSNKSSSRFVIGSFQKPGAADINFVTPRKFNSVTKDRLLTTFLPKLDGIVDHLNSISAPSSSVKLVCSAFVSLLYFESKDDTNASIEAIHTALSRAEKLMKWGFEAKTIAGALLVNMNEDAIAQIDPDLQKIVARYHTIDMFSKIFTNITDLGRKYILEALQKHESSPEVWAIKAANDTNLLTSQVMNHQELQKLAQISFLVTSELLKAIGLETAGLELENIGFFNMSPKEYEKISDIITDTTKLTRVKMLGHLHALCQLIAEELDREGIKCRFEYGVKSVASAYKKLLKPEETYLTDAARFRIIIDGTPDDCKKAFEVINEVLSTNGYFEYEAETKNYVKGLILKSKSNPLIDIGPKANGYESIHVLYKGTEKGEEHPISIQIRTAAMHEVAEKGTASHGNYKTEGLIDISPKALPFPNQVNVRGRFYGLNSKGMVYRLMPMSAKHVITIADLAYAISPKCGLSCPNYVQIKRFNPAEKAYKEIKVPIFEPLQDGDMLLFTPNLGKVQISADTAAGRIERLGTLTARAILQAAITFGEDIADNDQRSSQIAALAQAEFARKLDELKRKLSLKLRKIVLAERGPSIEDIVPIFSIERIAGILTGNEDTHNFYLQLGLLNMPEDTIKNALSIIEDSSTVASYKVDEKSHTAEVWILTKDIPGISYETLKVFNEAQLQPMTISSENIGQGIALFKIATKTRPEFGKAQINEALKGLENIYKGKPVSYLPPKNKSTYMMEFDVAKFELSFILKILEKIAERKRFNIHNLQIKPTYKQRGSFGVAIKSYNVQIVLETLPSIDQREIDQFLRKFPPEFKFDFKKTN